MLKKDEAIQLRVSQPVKEALQDLADADGMTLSQLAYNALLTYAARAWPRRFAADINEAT
jgi:antitoxin component of RelBE/YafQ-DinJ toxin-antitoxin module